MMSFCGKGMYMNNRAAEALDHEPLRGQKHLGFGAAEAVDALFGVAHDEHAGGLAGRVWTFMAQKNLNSFYWSADKP